MSNKNHNSHHRQEKVSHDGMEHEDKLSPESAARPVPAEEELKKRIEILEKELSEAKDKLLREYADFDNFRKRSRKDMSDLRIIVRGDTMIPMLKVLDHFKLALDASEKKADFKVLDGGMKLIAAEFAKAMTELEISTVDASEGQDFDPNTHEAIGKEPSEEHPEGKILKLWRHGYKIGERLLRPAVVVISSGPTPQCSTTGT